MVGFVEIKAPDKGADPRKYKGHDKEQRDKLQYLPNLLYTDGNAFGLWRNGEPEGAIIHLIGDVENSGHALAAANAGGDAGCWIVQERIPIRREVFPYITKPGSADSTVDFKDMLVDFAPYLFRGKLAGFLTRLSATGLANVTSGGGQVPAFRVNPRH